MGFTSLGFMDMIPSLTSILYDFTCLMIDKVVRISSLIDMGLLFISMDTIKKRPPILIWY